MRTAIDSSGDQVDISIPISALTVREVACLPTLNVDGNEIADTTLPLLRTNNATVRFLSFPVENLYVDHQRIQNEDMWKVSEAVRAKFDTQTFSEAELGHLLEHLGTYVTPQMLLKENWIRNIDDALSVTPDEEFQADFWRCDVEKSGGSPKQALVLSKYVPSMVVRRLIATRGKPTFPFSDTVSAAVMFSDISGFTAVTETLVSQGLPGIEKLSQYLNKFFSRMISIIRNHGGDVAKFAGDALIVLWPTSKPAGLRHSARLACQCALELTSELSTFDAGGIPLSLHLGISAGEMRCMYLGSEERSEFVISGQPLLEATSCEALAKAGEIVITSSAQILVGIDKLKLKKRSGLAGAARLDEMFDRIQCNQISLPLSDFIEPAVSYIPKAFSTHLSRIGSDEYLAQLRMVTVLFIQIPLPDSGSQFTTDLQVAFNSIVQTVYSYEGDIRQLIVDDKGTVCIAAFGLPPSSHEDDSHRGVLAALRIRDVLQKLTRTTASIGVTSGKVFCGPVGSADRREYALVGSAVVRFFIAINRILVQMMTFAPQNMSARIMAQAAGRVLCDKHTYNLTHGRFSFKSCPPLFVKGKSESLDVYEAIAEATVTSARQRRMLFAVEKMGKRRSHNLPRNIISASGIEYIGREAELVQIADAVKRVVDAKKRVSESSESSHSASIFCINGISGSGKSALASELMLECRHGGLRVFKTYAYSSDITIPFGCLRPIILKTLDSLLSQRGFEPHEDIGLEKWLEALSHFFSPENLKLLPMLHDIVPSIRVPEDDSTDSLRGESRALKLSGLCTQILKRSSIDVFIFEDVQWMDLMSWSTIVQLGTEMEAGKMIAVTCRPAKASWTASLATLTTTGSGRDVTVLDLKPLDTVQIKRVIAGLCGVEPDGVSADLVNAIERMTEGIPLAVSESVKAYLHSKTIVVSNGHATGTFSGAPEMNSHRSLAAVCLAQFDTLNIVDQLLLKIAAVSGRHFSAGMLSAIAHDVARDTIGNKDTDARLVDLCALGFFNTREEHTRSYMFRSTLQREAIYDVMLGEQKRLLHSKMAGWIIQNSETPDPAQLAGHYKGAGEWLTALTYLSQCVSLSLRQGAFREAVEQCIDCLETAKHLNSAQTSQIRVDLAMWNRCIGEAWFNLQVLHQSLAYFGTSLRLLGMTQPEDGAASASHLISRLKHRLIDIEAKKDTPRETSGIYVWKVRSKLAVAQMRAAGMTQALLAYLTVGVIQYYMSKPEQMIYSALSALKLAAYMDHRAEYIALAGVSILALSAVGRHDLASQLMDHSTRAEMTVAAEVGNYDSQVSICRWYFGCAVYFYSIAEWDQATKNFDRLWQISQSQSRYAAASEACVWNMFVLFWQCKWKETFEMTTTVLQLSVQLGSTFQAILCHVVRMYLALLQNRVKRAKKSRADLDAVLANVVSPEIQMLARQSYLPALLAFATREQSESVIIERATDLVDSLEATKQISGFNGQLCTQHQT
jgi:class 3 adenylate cyclase